jgi:hypothetical protein
MGHSRQYISSNRSRSSIKLIYVYIYVCVCIGGAPGLYIDGGGFPNGACSVARPSASSAPHALMFLF